MSTNVCPKLSTNKTNLCMNITILKEKKLQNGKKWYLAVCNLLEYIESLKDEFFNYDIQRRIVKNSYLDKLWTTISSGDPLPSITLTANVKEDIDNSSVDEFEILDGLQRSFRLWAIKYLDDLLKRMNTQDVSVLIEKMRKDENGKRLLDSKVINRSILRKLLTDDKINIKNLMNCYAQQDIVLNIWSGLNDEEIINKMLTLNAGQRSVSSTHQFELMFLHYFKKLEVPKGVQIIRERDDEYFSVKKKERKCGQFIMSSIIIAIQSLIERKPVRIQTVNDLRTNDSVVEESSASFFTKDNLEAFINLLLELDKKFDNDQIGSWIMKDTTLSGLFAAIGAVYNQEWTYNVPSMLDFIHNKITVINDDNINYSEFNDAYNNLSSVTVNIGNAVRKAVYIYFKNLFLNKPMSWQEAFNRNESEEK